MNSNNQTYRSTISRKEIEDYKSMSDQQKNTLEAKALEDPFSQDALEGWETVDYNLDLMSTLDSKFNYGKSSPVTNWIVYLLSIFTIIVSITGILFSEKAASTLSDQDSEKASPPLATITLDKSDVISDSIIEQMPDFNSNTTASAPILQQKFKEKKAMPDLPEIEFIIEDLPVLNLEIPTSLTKEIKTRSQVKEIYLSDLKLVDYRPYRSRPTIKTEQLVLSGVPANMENGESSPTESTWKTVDVPYHDYLKKAIEQVSLGKYKKALQRFNIILETYGDDINSQFYSGICFYNLQNYNEAIEHFKVCLTHPYSNFDEESLWLLANSYEALNKWNEAKEIYIDIENKGGFYANQAKKKLKK